jgi:branched-subunit amino acid ABC-type transport system permease component
VQFGALGFAGGFGLGLKALAAAILGGVGSVPGALLGGLAIGLFETLWSAFLPIEGRDLALFVVLILFITLRPEGLFGAAPPLKVPS